MKIIKKINFLIFLLCFIIILELINYKIFYNVFYLKKFNIKTRKRKINIEVDIYGKEGERGPSKFIRGLRDILPYNNSKCSFISSENISLTKGSNESDFFFFPFTRFSESVYNEWITLKKANKLILGPIFVPFLWNLFPYKEIWYERNFSEIIRDVKGIGVHSIRVRNYLSQRSNTIDKINKYIIIRPCSNFMPKNIKSFYEREIDILFFEKYADLNHTFQAIELLELFKKSSKKIEKIIYGNYTKNIMEKLANNTKFIIYFSFFDTGAIGLKEIQNYGVFAFTHQKEFVIDKRTSFWIPELAGNNTMNIAYEKISKIIERIIKLHPNSQLIAKINQEFNNCQNAFDDLCEGLLKT